MMQKFQIVSEFQLPETKVIQKLPKDILEAKIEEFNKRFCKPELWKIKGTPKYEKSIRELGIGFNMNPDLALAIINLDHYKTNLAFGLSGYEFPFSWVF